MLLLAGEVARGLREPRLKLRLTRLGARLLAIQRITLHAQTMQHGRAGSLLVAQGLKLFGGFRLMAKRFAFGLGLLRHKGERLLEGGLLLLDQRASPHPMEMMLKSLHLADLAGDLAVALRLARLAPECLQLR